MSSYIWIMGKYLNGVNNEVGLEDWQRWGDC